MEKFHIGTITQAHGIKGLVKIISATDNDSLFNGDVQTDDATLLLSFKNRLGKYLLAKIEGVIDRNQAEALKGTKLYINETALPDDDFRHLIGADVIENDTVIGTVTAIENYGAGDLFETTLTTGQTILIPDNENFVITINDAIIVQNYKDLLFD